MRYNEYLCKLINSIVIVFIYNLERSLKGRIAMKYMQRVLISLGIFTLVVTLSACDLLQRGLDQEDMNVYFYKPDGEELYLGLVRGINLCRSTVVSKAKALAFDGDGGMPVNPGENEHILSDETNTGKPGWTYHCCWKTTTNTCKEKLK